MKEVEQLEKRDIITMTILNYDAVRYVVLQIDKFNEIIALHRLTDIYIFEKEINLTYEELKGYKWLYLKKMSKFKFWFI